MSKVSGPNDSAPKRPGWRWWQIIGAFICVVAVVGVISDERQMHPAPASTDLTPAPIHCDKAWSEGALRRAQSHGIVRGQELQALDFIVVVNPVAWNQLSLDAQKMLGLAVACQLKDGFAGPSVHFRAFRDGSDLLSLSSNELLPLAHARFAAIPTAPAPDGVRGRKWGARRTADLKAVAGSDQVFMPTGEPAAFLGIGVAQEDFTFEHGHLFGGDLFIKGIPAWGQLKTALTTAYGAPATAETTDKGEAYTWSWPRQNVSLSVTYTIKDQTAWVRMAKN